MKGKASEPTADLLKMTHERLISLYNSAIAIISTLKTNEVLNLTVDNTRKLAYAEKAVLVLLGENTEGFRLNFNQMVVRGRRREHPESWWRARIEKVAEEVFRTGKSLILPKRRTKKASSLLCVPVTVKGKSVGILAALNPLSRTFSREDTMILSVLASHAGVAIENARLYERIRKLAAAREKNRIAKEMHDSIAQTLFGITLNLETCLKLLPDHSKEAKAKIKTLQGLARRSLWDIRQNIFRKGRELEKLSLPAIVREQVKEFCKVSDAVVQCTIQGRRKALPENIKRGLYRILEETLSNVARHARATEVLIRLRYGKKGVSLAVEDNGTGFDVERELSEAEVGGKMGLLNIKERAEVLGGSLNIVSTPDRGTILKITIPT